MAFQPLCVEVDTQGTQNPVVDKNPAGAAGVIVNVGGTTILINGQTVTLPGPDTAILTAGVGDGYPRVFVLLPGASLAFPADIVPPVYARAANTTTTLSTAIATP